MYLTLIFLPMLGSIVAGMFGRKVGVTGAQFITVTSIITCAVLSLTAFYEVGLCNSPVSINLCTWIDSEIIDVSWGFMFDSLTVSILLAVVLVSTLVHIFSIDYMSADPHNQRFFSYLSIFTFFMLILVTGDNYLIIFVGWEGIGISSYLLINFWFTRIQASKSGIKALTVNRVGDMFLSVAFFAIFFVFGNLDYSTVFSVAPFINESLITIIGLLLLFAAIGKSAQIGLHTWLPDSYIWLHWISIKIYFIHFYNVCKDKITKAFTKISFVDDDEKGPWPKSTEKRKSRTINNYFYSVVIGLMVSNRLQCRTYKNTKSSRFVYQTFEDDEDWKIYLLHHFSSYCSKGWSTVMAPVKGGYKDIPRYILTTLSYPCFHPIFLIFFPIPKAPRLLSQKILKDFNAISLSALIIACGYHQVNVYEHWGHGLSFYIKISYFELNLLQARLKEIGINSDIIKSVNRFDRHAIRLRIAFSEFTILQNICREHIIQSKIYLIENKSNS